jgi:hypothetical protein
MGGETAAWLSPQFSCAQKNFVALIAWLVRFDLDQDKRNA